MSNVYRFITWICVSCVITHNRIILSDTFGKISQVAGSYQLALRFRTFFCFPQTNKLTKLIHYYMNVVMRVGRFLNLLGWARNNNMTSRLALILKRNKTNLTFKLMFCFPPCEFRKCLLDIRMRATCWHIFRWIIHNKQRRVNS